jgi:hypothetical protein
MTNQDHLPEDHQQNHSDAPVDVPAPDAEPMVIGHDDTKAQLHIQEDEAPSHEQAEENSAGSHLKRNLLIAAVVVLNLGMGTASAAMLVKKPAQQKLQASTSSASTNTTVDQSSSAPAATADAKTLHYVSKPLNLEFDYPIDWHIYSDSSNKNISISSTPTDIKDATGRAEQGRLVINIDSKYPDNTYYTVDDNSVIVANSEAIKYSDPTKVQRQSTNISFARGQYDTGDSVSMMFISGNLNYSKGQHVADKNYKAINPFLTFYVDGCRSKCEGPSQAAFSIDDYHSNPMFAQAQEYLNCSSGGGNFSQRWRSSLCDNQKIWQDTRRRHIQTCQRSN